VEIKVQIIEVIRAHRDTEVSKEIEDTKAFKAQEVTKVLLDFKARRATKVSLVIKARRG
jgi:hypothetical protein